MAKNVKLLFLRIVGLIIIEGINGGSRAGKPCTDAGAYLFIGCIFDGNIQSESYWKDKYDNEFQYE